MNHGGMPSSASQTLPAASVSLILALALSLATPPLLANSSQPAPAPASPSNHEISAAGIDSKIDPWLLRPTSAAANDFLIVLQDQADLSGAAELRTKAAKGAWVVEQLRKTARLSQGSLLAILKAEGVEHRPFWIVNMVLARGNDDLMRRLAARNDIARLVANPIVAADLPIAEPSAPASRAIEQSLTHIQAPTFWGAGFDGQGIVVGIEDTGIDWDHPALQSHYRGWDGSNADHDYNWHDSVHSGGGSCGADSPEPCDDGSHGTHVTGTIVGDDGGSNQIGVAPGAKWIGCRNMDRGNGTPATYSECFQFFIAPTDLSGANPRPDLAPDIINNSWGCPPSEGCTDRTVLQAVIETTRAAGISVVGAAGNSGPSCSTIADPPAIYDATFTVAATNNSDQITGFSSRGPVTSDSSGRLKPDVAAPGSSIRSSTPGGGYSSFSGTSMASPHVAGLAALYLSASPCFRGDPDGLEQLIRDTVVPLTSTQTCGSFPGANIPNAVYGHGGVRAELAAAMDACGEIFRDGFESGTTSLWVTVIP